MSWVVTVAKGRVSMNSEEQKIQNTTLHLNTGLVRTLAFTDSKSGLALDMNLKHISAMYPSWCMFLLPVTVKGEIADGMARS